MLVKDWMTADVIALTQDRSMMKASKIMKDKKISRIPIVDDENRVVGIVTDRDVKEASPSKATTLDMHELYYLLSEIKLKDIMTRKPKSLHENDTIEMAAALFKNNKFGGMPVVDDEDKLVGVITDTDIFNVLVSITGVMEGGVSIGFRLSNQPGGLVPVLDFLKDHSARVMSLLTSCASPEEDKRNVFIRIRDMEKSELKKLRAELEKEFEVVHWVRDSIDPVV